MGDDGQVYICLDEPLPAMMDEDEAVADSGGVDELRV